MRLEETTTVRARPADVWAVVGDPVNYDDLFGDGLRWRRRGRGAVKVGSRYHSHMRIGSAEVGGLVEVVELDPGRELAWTSINGIEQRGRWRLRDGPRGTTKVTLRFSYQSPGGLWGVIAERVSGPKVRAVLREALRALRERCEPEPQPGAGRGPVDTTGRQIQGLAVLAAAGLLRPQRPDRLIAAGLALHRWGLTMPGGFAAAEARFPGNLAVIDPGGALTFREVEQRSNAVAAGLASLGVREGDSVGLMCRNHAGFVVGMLALGKLGADVLMLNTGFAGPQLREVLRREHAAAVIVDEEFRGLLGDAVLAGRTLVAAGSTGAAGSPSLEEMARTGDRTEPGPPERHSRITILTSGTTGSPKGASRAQPSSIEPAVALLSRIPLRQRETTLVSAPLFHAWGFAHLSLGLLLSSTLVLQPQFDAEAVLAAIDKHRVTALVAVPVMLRRILDLPEEVRSRYDTASLRVVAVSGSALSGALATRFMDAFGDVVYNLYGSTEVAWATIASPADLRAAPGTAGRPPMGTVLRIVDHEGEPVAAGATGRIFVGNDMLFEGYTGGGSKATLDGLMATGDVGRLDSEGRLFVEGRDDEMIVSGGENVFPAEVEELLGAHPAILEAAVVGVPDEEWGQRLAAHVVTRPGASLSEDQVKAHVRGRLARYKVPREVHFLDELPRNATGKVIKRALVEPAGGRADSTDAAPRTAPRPRRAAPRGTARRTAGTRRRAPSG